MRCNADTDIKLTKCDFMGNKKQRRRGWRDDDDATAGNRWGYDRERVIKKWQMAKKSQQMEVGMRSSVKESSIAEVDRKLTKCENSQVR